MSLWDASKMKEEVIDFVSGWDKKSKTAYDNLFIPYEIEADRVWELELYRQGYVKKEELEAAEEGLTKLQKRYERGELNMGEYEDVHTLVELELDSIYGELVGNIHLGKSRNDQVCTLARMWMRDKLRIIDKHVEEFISTLEDEIERKGEIVFPGHTHHRPAMPTTYRDLLNSYIAGFKRDRKGFEYWLKQYNECPLGAAAAFGAPINIDRERVAKELGFYRTAESTIDSVTTRWEAEASFAFNLSVLANHLSTIAQDFIYYSSGIKPIISLPPEYCTGSSIMPQKLNPSILEIIKAKASLTHGRLSSLLSIGRGNISGYNRDTQWTKYAIVDAVQEFDGLFDVLSGLVKGVQINEKHSKELLEKGGAYTAEEAVKRTIQSRRTFREEKLTLEREIKDKRPVTLK